MEDGRVSQTKEGLHVKVMLIAFFDHQGLIHHEFVPQGQTVNQHFYKEVLSHLIARIQRSRRDSWENEVDPAL